MASIEQARAEAGNTIGVDPALVQAQVRIEAAAANRIVELDGPDAATAEEGRATAPNATARAPRRLQLNILGHRGVWDAKDNPFVVGWWPGFANDWLNRKLG